MMLSPDKALHTSTYMEVQIHSTTTTSSRQSTFRYFSERFILFLKIPIALKPPILLAWTKSPYLVGQLSVIHKTFDFVNCCKLLVIIISLCARCSIFVDFTIHTEFTHFFCFFSQFLLLYYSSLYMFDKFIAKKFS